MLRRRYLSLVTMTLTLAALVVSGCATPAPSTVPPQPPPTDTVVYDVPTAPASPTTQRPATTSPTGAPLPPTTGAVTAPPPEARGSLPQTRLTIMHTNDSRGYLDPCG